MHHWGQRGQAADVVEVVLGRARHCVDEQVARAPAAIDVDAEGIQIDVQAARIDVGVAIAASQAELQRLGARLQRDPNAIAVRRRLADDAARVGLGPIGQGGDRDRSSRRPGVPSRQAGGRAVQRVFAVPPRRLAQHGGLGAQVAIVEIVIGQPRDRGMTGRRRVDAVEVEIVIGVGANRDAVEAGLSDVADAKG